MPSETPVHDYVFPRLRSLVSDAVAEGFDPLTVTAVVTDILASTDMLAELGRDAPAASPAPAAPTVPRA